MICLKPLYHSTVYQSRLSILIDVLNIIYRNPVLMKIVWSHPLFSLYEIPDVFLSTHLTVHKPIYFLMPKFSKSIHWVFFFNFYLNQSIKCNLKTISIHIDFLKIYLHLLNINTHIRYIQHTTRIFLYMRTIKQAKV